jgi:ATP-binding cassette subfamily B protein
MTLEAKTAPTEEVAGGGIRVLGPFLRPYRGAAIGAAIVLIIHTLLKLIGPVILQRAIDDGIRRSNPAVVTRYGIAFLSVAVGMFIALRFATLLMGWVGQHALRDIRVAAFRNVADQSLGFFEKERSGRLVARITSDTEAIEKLVTEDLIRLATTVTFLFGAVILLFVLDPKLALAALAVTPLMTYGTVVFRRRARNAYRQVRERIASVLSFLQETLRGVHVVQAFARERVSRNRFGDFNEEWADAKAGTYLIESAYFSALEFLSGLGTAIVLTYGGWLVFDDRLTLGTLTTFVVYLSLFFDPIHHLSERYTNFQSALAGLVRIAHLLKLRPDVVEVQKPVKPKLTGSINLEDVSFRYSADGPAVLDDVSLTIAAGEFVGLVGPTGAGKSTIVKLMARFFDATQGRVALDDTDIRSVAFEALRAQVALVPQESFLFSGTIRENILFGKPDANPKSVEQVCRDLGIDEFIKSLPEGYETHVRERGARLAAGERQLIALARALMADPAIILLDEATSSLDPATEASIDAALGVALAGRTRVVIAHRLSTVLHADRIVVIEDGRVVESGSHEDLLRMDVRYAALHQSWLTATSPR